MTRLAVVCALVLAVCGMTNATGCKRLIISHGKCDVKGTYYARLIPYGLKVYCECDPGYDWTGPVYYTCYSYGYYPVPEHGCVKRVTCDAPPQPDKGYYRPVQKDYFPKNKIQYKCDDGYALSNSKYEYRVCTSKGTWDRPAPYCVQLVKYCSKPTPIIYGSFAIQKKKYSHPDSVTYSCDVGFYYDGNKYFQCKKDGSWFPQPFPKACLRMCKRPGKPVKGDFKPVQDYYKIGKTVVYGCAKYYELVGYRVLTCLKGGSWNYDPPVCRPTCPGRSAPSKGFVKPSKSRYSVGDDIVFSCQPGYFLNGNPKDKCESNGEWAVNRPPTCDKKCKVGKLSSYVLYSPSGSYFSVGKSIYFKCSGDEFELVGSEKSTCQKDGTWDRKYPICVRKCYPPSIDNGGVVDEEKYYLGGAYIEYYCTRGYVLYKGEDSARCLANGKWSYIARCLKQEKKCKGHTIDNGGRNPAYDWYNSGITIYYYCSSGYQLDGKSQNECLDSGNWKYSIPECVEKDYGYSCKNRCGDRFDYGLYSCQCHPLCVRKRNCCRDYTKLCPVSYLY